METNTTLHSKLQKKQKTWFLLLTSTLLLSTLLILFTIITSSFTTTQFLFLYTHTKKTHHLHFDVPHFVESKLPKNPVLSSSLTIPRLAYLISGSAGDVVSVKRTLKALYHPRNQYAVHLDLEASAEERLELAKWVREDEVFNKVGNVRVIVRSNLVTYRGPTMVTNTLHAAAILLRDGGHWDWFINLSASDYPLVTQDDLLHTLSEIPRNLNFIEHTSDIGWKEYHRARPVIIDPGLYSLQKSDVYWTSEERRLPTAYKLFTGSAWMMLSRPFIEYCIWGWDNLPRIVLMYYANFLSSPEGYFHTVICNAEEFKNTTVNHDLHFISWDNPPKQHPHFLTLDDFQAMVDSNAPFARKFDSDDSVLDKIDSDILGRNADGFSPSGWWFSNEGDSNMSVLNNIRPNSTDLKPGPGAERLKNFITGLLSAEDFDSSHCI
ncbi:beta-glucuronosyltransferase GlcAT14B-like [Mercurialis annua]|uniref:beta-glucuronosyltransferase GlcAT14B-like n=1 Tax=Mercurialis annua TaxID=3986 RepID=UPI00215F5974|nr:beta-glucuronosyltransferase GlcAT14B-like [Mercurialis annua]